MRAMVAEFMQARAERYSLATRAAPDARLGELQKLVAAVRQLGIERCNKIVELGAGHGFATAALTEFLTPEGLLFAIDNSAPMLDRIAAHRNVHPMLASLSELDVESGTVDLVVSLAAFHHVTHKTLVMNEARRVLRVGGYVVIADVHHGTPVQEFFDRVVRKHCSTGHDWDFLDESWVELIARRSGLVHLWSRVENTDWRFNSEDTMLQYLADLTSLDLPIAQLKPLVDQCLHPRIGTDGRSIHLPWSLGFHALRTAPSPPMNGYAAGG